MSSPGKNRGRAEEAKAVESEIAARLPRATRTTVKILEAFLERPMEERHGFKLFDQTKVQSGTGYPILLRLEKIGWLSSRWEETNEPGPRRRLYRLTAEGEPAVRRFLAEKQAGRFRLGEMPKPSAGEVGP